MTETRKIRKVFKSKPTIEGAGVHLKRALGHSQVPMFDPFLLLDDFRSDNPQHYIKGFPWHPHRGIETNVPVDVCCGFEGCTKPATIRIRTKGWTNCCFDHYMSWHQEKALAYTRFWTDASH